MKIGLKSPSSPGIGDDNRAVQPLVGMKRHWQHPAWVAAIEDVRSNLCSGLMAVSLTDVRDSRQTFSSVHRLALQIENFGCRRVMSNGGARKIDGCLPRGDSKGIEYGVTLDSREGLRHDYKVVKDPIGLVRGRNAAHFQCLGDSSPSCDVSMFAAFLPSVHDCYGGPS